MVDDLRRAMDYAAELGCTRITTCPLNDGADTLFEVDYVRLYDYVAETLAAACSHNREVRICIEYKQSDPEYTVDGFVEWLQQRGIDAIRIQEATYPLYWF